MERLRPGIVVLGILVLLAGVVLAALWVGQRRLIYFPDPAAPPPAAGVRDVALVADDGVRLGAWLAPPTGPDRRIAVLVTPGNGGHRGDRAPLAAALAARGFTVLLLDYRGYGGNDGSPSEDGLARDARAAYAHLTGEAGFPPERVLFFGESLGAGVAANLAATHRPAGLLLRSPFDSLAAVAGHHYPYLPVRALLRDRYPVAERVAALDVPTVVVLGDVDSVIPPERSRAVAARAAGPVRVVEVPGADHNDPALTHGPAVVDALSDLASTIAPA